MNGPVIRVENLAKTYRTGRVEVPALKGVSLTIGRGEFVAVMGPSGSGKSTFLNLIGCLDHPTSGQVLIGEQDVATLGDDALSDLRAEKIGFIFQTFNLIPVLSALENVEFPLLVRPSSARVARASARDRARRALAEVGLAEFAHHRPDELSGGQRQRVAIARATILAPAVLLADEPTGNLDQHIGHEVVALLEALNAAGTTLIVVTHDGALGARARRHLAMRDGRIVGDTP